MSFINTSKIMLRSLFSKPSTAMYPLKKREPYAATRGSIGIEINECVFCGLCAKKCPTGALAVSRDEKSWTIDRFKCISCGACVGSCVRKCLEMKTAYTPPATTKSTERFVQKLDKPNA